MHRGANKCLCSICVAREHLGCCRASVAGHVPSSSDAKHKACCHVQPYTSALCIGPDILLCFWEGTWWLRRCKNKAPVCLVECRSTWQPVHRSSFLLPRLLGEALHGSSCRSDRHTSRSTARRADKSWCIPWLKLAVSNHSLLPGKACGAAMAAGSPQAAL